MKDIVEDARRAALDLLINSDSHTTRRQCERVPHLIAEIDRLRNREAEQSGRLALWLYWQTRDAPTHWHGVEALTWLIGKLQKIGLEGMMRELYETKEKGESKP